MNCMSLNLNCNAEIDADGGSLPPSEETEAEENCTLSLCLGVDTEDLCRRDEIVPLVCSALLPQVVEKGIRCCPTGTMQVVLGDPDCLPVEGGSGGASIVVLA